MNRDQYTISLTVVILYSHTLVSLAMIIALHQKTEETRKVLVTGSNKTQETITHCTNYKCLQKPYVKKGS
jgi:hypothetical protein